MTPTIAIGLVVAGGIAAPTRYVLDGVVQDRTAGAFPWGTFAVNVTGSFMLGLITGAALYHAFPSTPKIWLGTGFCGAYTTFSTFTFETIRLLEEGAVADAFRNAVATLVVGTLAAGLGLAVAAALMSVPVQYPPRRPEYANAPGSQPGQSMPSRATAASIALAKASTDPAHPASSSGPSRTRKPLSVSASTTGATPSYAAAHRLGLVVKMVRVERHRQARTALLPGAARSQPTVRDIAQAAMRAAEPRADEVRELGAQRALRVVDADEATQ